MQDEMTNTNENMEEMEAALAELKSPSNGDIVKARVDEVNDNERNATVTLIDEATGNPIWGDSIVISGKDLTDNPDAKISDVVKVNDLIDVVVVALSGKDGDTKVSKTRADRMTKWKEMDGIDERGETVKATVRQVVKGGLVADVDGLRAFIPASQVDLRYVKDLSVYVGQTFDALPIECDVKKQRLVLSRRNILEKERAEKQEKLFSTLEEGQVLDGTVKRLVEYGAFIDIGGVDGLAHISDLSWDRVKHPSDVLEVGQTLKVKVKSFDPEKKRISLSVKDTLPDPWYDRVEKYQENEEIEGKIIKLTDFGAFMEIETGFDGLIPMGELSDKRIARADEAVHTGDIVRVKILRIDKNRRRISLSMTRVHKDKDAAADAE